MNELGPDAQLLLEAAQGGDDPSAADAARVREKLARRLPLAAAAAATTAISTQVAAGGASAAAGISAGTAAGAGAAGAGLGASAATGSVLALSKKVLVAAVIASGSVTAGSVVLRSMPEASTPVESQPDAQASTAPQEAPSLPNPELSPPLAPAPSPEANDSAQASPPSFKPAPAEPPPELAPSRSAAALPLKVDSVAEEAALLGAAHAALARGDGAAALAKLELHATRFPKGALAEERRAARVFALCSVGRVEQARSAAAAFLKQSPGSPLAHQVSRTCATPGMEDDFLTERGEPSHP